MKKILIIEDEQNIRETLSDLLSFHHYQIIEATCGTEGIRKALIEIPDIILCDVNMPDVDGYQVLAELKKNDFLTLIPFIFLTAKSSMEELRYGMILGADDYLIKPFDHKTLLQSIKTAENKKLAVIDQLNSLQNQLNVQKLKLQDIDYLNSHVIRRKLSLLQSLFPLIKSGELSMDEGMKVIETSGDQLDSTTHRVNGLINEQPEAVKKSNYVRLSKNETIWLIDDDQTQNLLTKMLLRKVNQHWTVCCFQNPLEALQNLHSDSPGLIFLDINMPEMNGFSFLDEAKKLNADLQVIILSSSISPVDIARSLSYSAVVNYLTKPIKKGKLEELLISV